METTLETKYGNVAVKFIWDIECRTLSIRIYTPSGHLIGKTNRVFGKDSDEIPNGKFASYSEFDTTELISLVEKYIDDDEIAYNMMTQMIGEAEPKLPTVNVLYVSDIDMLVTSKVLLVLSSECERSKAIDAIVEAIKMHEGYENDTTIDDDDEYDSRYTDDELRSKAVRMLDYGDEFYADRTYDSTFYIRRNMQIVG